MSSYGPKLDAFEELQRANADLTARAEELGAEIVRLRTLIPAEPGFEWNGDKPLPEDEAIKAAHPLRTGRHDLYREAMRLVGARHSKSGLVELVIWLLHRLGSGGTSLAVSGRTAAADLTEVRVVRVEDDCGCWLLVIGEASMSLHTSSRAIADAYVRHVNEALAPLLADAHRRGVEEYVAASLAQHGGDKAHGAGYDQALRDIEKWLRGMRRTSAAFFVDQLANAIKTGSWKHSVSGETGEPKSK